MALVLVAQKFGNGHEALAAHRVCGAGEQHLDLHVIELGRFLGQIAAGLEVKILQEISGELLRKLGRIDFRTLALCLSFCG